MSSTVNKLTISQFLSQLGGLSAQDIRDYWANLSWSNNGVLLDNANEGQRRRIVECLTAHQVRNAFSYWSDDRGHLEKFALSLSAAQGEEITDIELRELYDRMSNGAFFAMLTRFSGGRIRQYWNDLSLMGRINVIDCTVTEARRTIIQSLSFNQVNDFVNGVFNDPARLVLIFAQLTGAQVSALTLDFGYLTAAALNALSTLASRALSRTQLGQLNRSAYEGLSAGFVSALSDEQIGYLTHIDWLGTAGVSGLSPTQVSAIGIDFSWMSASWLNALTDWAVSGLRQAQLEQLSHSAYRGLGLQFLGALSVEQFSQLWHPDWLDSAVVSGLSADKINAISISFTHMSSAWLGALGASVVSQLSMLKFGQMSSSQIQSLNVAALSAGQLAYGTGVSGQIVLEALVLSQWNSIAGSVLAGIDRVVVGRVTRTQLLGMSDMRLQLLNASGLTAAQLSHINTQINKSVWERLSTSQLAAVSVESLSGLSVAMVGRLTQAMLSRMSIGQIQALDGGGLSVTQLALVVVQNNKTLIEEISAAQIAQLSLSVISGMPVSLLKKLSVGRMKALTSTQVSQLQGVQLAQLTVVQVQALNYKGWTAAQLGMTAISGQKIIEVLDSAQLVSSLSLSADADLHWVFNRSGSVLVEVVETVSVRERVIRYVNRATGRDLARIEYVPSAGGQRYELNVVYGHADMSLRYVALAASLLVSRGIYPGLSIPEWEHRVWRTAIELACQAVDLPAGGGGNSGLSDEDCLINRLADQLGLASPPLFSAFGQSTQYADLEEMLRQALSPAVLGTGFSDIFDVMLAQRYARNSGRMDLTDEEALIRVGAQKVDRVLIDICSERDDFSRLGISGQMVIRGEAAAGNTLYCLDQIENKASPITQKTMQWQQSVDGLNWVDIPGAIASSWVVDAGLEGRQIRVQVSLTDGSGRSYAIESASQWVAQVMVGDDPNDGVDDADVDHVDAGETVHGMRLWGREQAAVTQYIGQDGAAEETIIRGNSLQAVAAGGLSQDVDVSEGARLTVDGGIGERVRLGGSGQSASDGQLNRGVMRDVVIDDDARLSAGEGGYLEGTTRLNGGYLSLSEGAMIRGVLNFATAGNEVRVGVGTTLNEVTIRGFDVATSNVLCFEGIRYIAGKTRLIASGNQLTLTDGIQEKTINFGYAVRAEDYRLEALDGRDYLAGVRVSTAPVLKLIIDADGDEANSARIAAIQAADPHARTLVLKMSISGGFRFSLAGDQDGSSVSAFLKELGLDSLKQDQLELCVVGAGSDLGGLYADQSRIGSITAEDWAKNALVDLGNTRINGQSLAFYSTPGRVNFIASSVSGTLAQTGSEQAYIEQLLASDAFVRDFRKGIADNGHGLLPETEIHCDQPAIAIAGESTAVGVSHWNQPTQVREAIEIRARLSSQLGMGLSDSTMNHDHQLIIQMQDDPSALEACLLLAAKHPDDSTIIQWDGESFRVLHGRLDQVQGAVLWQTVGHGQIGSDQIARLSGMTSDQLLTSLADLQNALRTAQPDIASPQKISLAACNLQGAAGTDALQVSNSDSFGLRVSEGLSTHGLTSVQEVTARSGVLNIDLLGRKLAENKITFTITSDGTISQSQQQYTIPKDYLGSLSLPGGTTGGDGLPPLTRRNSIYENDDLHINGIFVKGEANNVDMGTYSVFFKGSNSTYDAEKGAYCYEGFGLRWDENYNQFVIRYGELFEFSGEPRSYVLSEITHKKFSDQFYDGHDLNEIYSFEIEDLARKYLGEHFEKIFVKYNEGKLLKNAIDTGDHSELINKVLQIKGDALLSSNYFGDDTSIKRAEEYIQAFSESLKIAFADANPNFDNDGNLISGFVVPDDKKTLIMSLFDKNDPARFWTLTKYLRNRKSTLYEHYYKGVVDESIGTSSSGIEDYDRIIIDGHGTISNGEFFIEANRKLMTASEVANLLLERFKNIKNKNPSIRIDSCNGSMDVKAAGAFTETIMSILVANGITPKEITTFNGLVSHDNYGSIIVIVTNNGTPRMIYASDPSLPAYLRKNVTIYDAESGVISTQNRPISSEDIFKLTTPRESDESLGKQVVEILEEIYNSSPTTIGGRDILGSTIYLYTETYNGFPLDVSTLEGQGGFSSDLIKINAEKIEATYSKIFNENRGSIDFSDLDIEELVGFLSEVTRNRSVDEIFNAPHGDGAEYRTNWVKNRYPFAYELVKAIKDNPLSADADNSLSEELRYDITQAVNRYSVERVYLDYMVDMGLSTTYSDLRGMSIEDMSRVVGARLGDVDGEGFARERERYPGLSDVELVEKLAMESASLKVKGSVQAEEGVELFSRWGLEEADSYLLSKGIARRVGKGYVLDGEVLRRWMVLDAEAMDFPRLARAMQIVSKEDGGQFLHDVAGELRQSEVKEVRNFGEALRQADVLDEAYRVPQGSGVHGYGISEGVNDGFGVYAEVQQLRNLITNWSELSVRDRGLDVTETVLGALSFSPVMMGISKALAVMGATEAGVKLGTAVLGGVVGAAAGAISLGMIGTQWSSFWANGGKVGSYEYKSLVASTVVTTVSTAIGVGLAVAGIAAAAGIAAFSGIAAAAGPVGAVVAVAAFLVNGIVQGALQLSTYGQYFDCVDDEIAQFFASFLGIETAGFKRAKGVKEAADDAANWQKSLGESFASDIRHLAYMYGKDGYSSLYYQDKRIDVDYALVETLKEKSGKPGEYDRSKNKHILGSRTTYLGAISLSDASLVSQMSGVAEKDKLVFNELFDVNHVSVGRTDYSEAYIDLDRVKIFDGVEGSTGKDIVSMTDETELASADRLIYINGRLGEDTLRWRQTGTGVVSVEVEGGVQGNQRMLVRRDGVLIQTVMLNSVDHYSIMAKGDITIQGDDGRNQFLEASGLWGEGDHRGVIALYGGRATGVGTAEETRTTFVLNDGVIAYSRSNDLYAWMGGDAQIRFVDETSIQGAMISLQEGYAQLSVTRTDRDLVLRGRGGVLTIKGVFNAEGIVLKHKNLSFMDGEGNRFSLNLPDRLEGTYGLEEISKTIVYGAVSLDGGIRHIHGDLAIGTSWISRNSGSLVVDLRSDRMMTLMVDTVLGSDDQALRWSFNGDGSVLTISQTVDGVKQIDITIRNYPEVKSQIQLYVQGAQEGYDGIVLPEWRGLEGQEGSFTSASVIRLDDALWGGKAPIQECEVILAGGMVRRFDVSGRLDPQHWVVTADSVDRMDIQISDDAHLSYIRMGSDLLIYDASCLDASHGLAQASYVRVKGYFSGLNTQTVSWSEGEGALALDRVVTQKVFKVNGVIVHREAVVALARYFVGGSGADLILMTDGEGELIEAYGGEGRDTYYVDMRKLTHQVTINNAANTDECDVLYLDGVGIDELEWSFVEGHLVLGYKGGDDSGPRIVVQDYGVNANNRHLVLRLRSTDADAQPIDYVLPVDLTGGMRVFNVPGGSGDKHVVLSDGQAYVLVDATDLGSDQALTIHLVGDYAAYGQEVIGLDLKLTAPVSVGGGVVYVRNYFAHLGGGDRSHMVFEGADGRYTDMVPSAVFAIYDQFSPSASHGWQVVLMGSAGITAAEQGWADQILRHEGSADEVSHAVARKLFKVMAIPQLTDDVLAGLCVEGTEPLYTIAQLLEAEQLLRSGALNLKHEDAQEAGVIGGLVTRLVVSGYSCGDTGFPVAVVEALLEQQAGAAFIAMVLIEELKVDVALQMLALGVPTERVNALNRLLQGEVLQGGECIAADLATWALRLRGYNGVWAEKLQPAVSRLGLGYAQEVYAFVDHGVTDVEAIVNYLSHGSTWSIIEAAQREEQGYLTGDRRDKITVTVSSALMQRNDNIVYRLTQDYVDKSGRWIGAGTLLEAGAISDLIKGDADKIEKDGGGVLAYERVDLADTYSSGGRSSPENLVDGFEADEATLHRFVSSTLTDVVARDKAYDEVRDLLGWRVGSGARTGADAYLEFALDQPMNFSGLKLKYDTVREGDVFLAVEALLDDGQWFELSRAHVQGEDLSTTFNFPALFTGSRYFSKYRVVFTDFAGIRQVPAGFEIAELEFLSGYNHGLEMLSFGAASGIGDRGLAPGELYGARQSIALFLTFNQSVSSDSTLVAHLNTGDEVEFRIHPHDPTTMVAVYVIPENRRVSTLRIESYTVGHVFSLAGVRMMSSALPEHNGDGLPIGIDSFGATVVLGAQDWSVSGLHVERKISVHPADLADGISLADESVPVTVGGGTFWALRIEVDEALGRLILPDAYGKTREFTATDIGEFLGDSGGFEVTLDDSLPGKTVYTVSRTYSSSLGSLSHVLAQRLLQGVRLECSTAAVLGEHRVVVSLLDQAGIRVSDAKQVLVNVRADSVSIAGVRDGDGHVVTQNRLSTRDALIRVNIADTEAFSGDTIKLYDDLCLLKTVVLSAEDIDRGYLDLAVSGLSSGGHSWAVSLLRGTGAAERTLSLSARYEAMVSYLAPVLQLDGAVVQERTLSLDGCHGRGLFTKVSIESSLERITGIELNFVGTVPQGVGLIDLTGLMTPWISGQTGLIAGIAVVVAQTDRGWLISAPADVAWTSAMAQRLLEAIGMSPLPLGRLDIELSVVSDRQSSWPVLAKINVVENHAPEGSVDMVAAAGSASRLLSVAFVNEVLEAGASFTDTDGLGDMHYQWQISYDGRNWRPISGAMHSQYVPQDADVGCYVRVVGIYVDGQGIEESIASAARQVYRSVVGSSAAQTLVGSIDQDYFSDVQGGDTLKGGGGDDIYEIGDAQTQIEEEEDGGRDTVITTADDIQLGDDVEDLILSGEAALKGSGNSLNNRLMGNGANNTLMGGDGNDVLDGGAGADRLVGGRGHDSYRIDDEGDVIIEEADGGYDTVESTLSYVLGEHIEFGRLLESITDPNVTEGVGTTLTGNVLDNVLHGNSGSNVLSGLAGNDVLYGGGGHDSLMGGSGDDILKGESGNDVFVGGAGDDDYYIDDEDMGGEEGLTTMITEHLDEGKDTVYTVRKKTTLGDHLEDMTLLEGALEGTGNGLDNLLIGNGADNLLRGMSGDDRLDGLGGDDTLIGGLGDDHYVVDREGDVVLEFADEGVDTVLASTSYSLGDHLENLVLTGSEAIHGRGNALNNRIMGNSGNNRLEGGEGDDTLEGGGGVDTLVGGSGDDRYEVGSSSDVVIENALGGTDTVYSRSNFVLGDFVEHLTLLGTDALNGRGNALNNILYGNSGDNALYGGGGSDTLNGGEGHDLLDGGAGADSLVGGQGDDIYVIDDEGDVVFERANEGTDTVRAWVSTTLGAHIENVILQGNREISATGNALNNRLTGNLAENTLVGGAGDDDLDGGAAADRMEGGQGDDRYLVDHVADEVVEWAGEGHDTVTTSVNYHLGEHIEDLYLIGGSDIRGTGNSLSNRIVGNSGNNHLEGGAGDDYIEGGAGADVIDGGAGFDTVSYQNSGSGVRVSLASGGIDEDGELLLMNGLGGEAQGDILSAIEQVLGSQYNDTITGDSGANRLQGGAGNDILDGAVGNDTLEGGQGDDTLNGGAGADRLVGGSGDDLYIVDHAGDTLIELANEGRDTVRASVSVTLGANIENLELTGTAALSGTGNSENNFITGNSGNNTLSGGAGDDVLNGGAGADRLVGGSGDDLYIVDHAGDTLIELANEGRDTVRASVSVTLGANIENLELTGTAALSGTGNSENNLITGNSAANSLSGGAGNDTLSGGAGNDSLDGGAGADRLVGGSGDDLYIVDHAGDTLIELANEGRDTVKASVSVTLGANIENLELTGTAALSGTGNSENNVITGNSAANSLSGGAGNDTLNGGAGNDTLNGGADADSLDGGAGADRLVGGSGDDLYVVDHAGDTLIELANEGRDTVKASVSVTLGANIENLELTGTAALSGTGNSENNVITGNSAANSLSGGAGNDSLNGGAGNDTLNGGAGNDSLDGGAGADRLLGGSGDDLYVVDHAGDTLIELANEGRDTVKASVSVTLGANIENLELTGTAALSGTGNSENNVITGNSAANSLSGGAGNDSLNGGAGNDTLNGGAGNDSLDGGAGADRLVGGSGDDLYVVDHAGDTLIELANEGRDTVKASVSVTLGANIENLELTGTAALSGTGNSENNVITGNSAANSLSGGAGNDTLSGGAGNDTLNGGAGADLLIGGVGSDCYQFSRGSGADIIRENDATAGHSDILELSSGINYNQLWFRKLGNNLEVKVIGSTDQVTVENWFLGSAYQIEQFKAGGKTLLNTDVLKLVNAMAAFAPPAAGQTTLPANLQTTLNPILSANWK
jgi:Ca2+-binding RTX toxin-like protein